jgi:hydrogenase nickel incorporation protein HypA/HybF
MHELSLMADLMRKLTAITREQGAKKLVRVTIKLGALAHISRDHFREHFVHAARGTPAEGARLDIVELTDETDLHAQGIVLESVVVET